MNPAEEACPMGGLHSLNTWLVCEVVGKSVRAIDGGPRGLACRRCHKSWRATRRGPVAAFA